MVFVGRGKDVNSSAQLFLPLTGSTQNANPDDVARALKKMGGKVGCR